MPDNEIEDMIAFLVAGCTRPARPRGSLVRELAARHPSSHALMLTFALTATAQALGEMMQGGRSEAAGLYRLGALLAVDVLVIQRQRARESGAAVTAADLLAHWGDSDPVFGA